MPGLTMPEVAAPLDLSTLDAGLTLWPEAFASAEADALFAALRPGLRWRQETIVMFGQPRLVPRLVSWHGDAGATYVYSGVTHAPQPWTAPLDAIRARVAELAGVSFNSVLANLYRDGRDGMGWHADDEPELGPEPVIASVSFGATRRFRMKHRRASTAPLDIPLTHGSVLVMRGATQRCWWHSVPKTARPVGERINLTFRWIRS